MRMIDCPVCNEKRGAKRRIGAGTILGVILTGLVMFGLFGFIWLPLQAFFVAVIWGVAVALYPVRCIVCGAKEAKDKERTKENVICFALLFGFLVLTVVMVCLKGNI